MLERVLRAIGRTFVSTAIFVAATMAWLVVGEVARLGAANPDWLAALAVTLCNPFLLHMALAIFGAMFLWFLAGAIFRRPRPIVIAVDGTAASGKGTLAKRVAAHFGFAHLDSGSLYRLVALTVIEAGGDPARKCDAVKAASRLDPTRRSDPALRTEDVGQAAALVAKIPAVRKLVHRFQVDFIARPPVGALGSVVDGRDIGTVIAPHATAKLYVDARPDVRAHRRWLEMTGKGIARDEAEILKEIQARDEADMSRAHSPLKRADDAFLLDTSEMDIDAAFAAALALVSPAVENALKAHAKG